MRACKGLLMLALLLSVSSMSMGCQAVPRIFATPEEAEAVAEAEHVGPPSVCSEWRVITYSRNDTPETTRQVIGNNAARHGYGCP